MTSRVASLVAGFLLVALAFAAGFQVADTREGLVAEVVTLLSGLAGTGLLIYGLVPKRPGRRASRPTGRQQKGPRTANDLLIGGSGLALVAILMTGLVVSGGWLWALFGGLLLLPMLIGCSYLIAAFASDAGRIWRIDLRQLTGR